MTARSELADIPARWSWLSRFASSAAHARHAALYGAEPTAAMKLGTAAHAVTFEQPFEVFRELSPKTDEVLNRSSNAWKTFAARCEADGVAPLNVAEYDKACRIRDALRAHADASPLLFGAGVVREEPIHWTRGAERRACSSRPDARKPGDWIADLKTCRTAQPYRFAKAAQWSGYPGQLVYYREADCFELGHSPERLGVDLFIVAVEPFAPYAITVFQLDHTARDFGQRSVASCWESLRAAEESNFWPAYSQSIVPLIIEPRDGDGADFTDIDPPDHEEPL